MTDLFKKRFELKENEKKNTHIEISIYYSKDNLQKSYRMCISPIKIESDGKYEYVSTEIFGCKLYVLEYVKIKNQMNIIKNLITFLY